MWQAWRTAGLLVDEVADIRPAQWEKAILNSTVGPLCFATGLPMHAVWADTELRCLVLAATAEGGRIAAAAGIALPTGLGERASDYFSRTTAHQPSVIKHPGELPWVLGRLCATAHDTRVEAPALMRIAALADAAVAMLATPIVV